MDNNEDLKNIQPEITTTPPEMVNNPPSAEPINDNKELNTIGESNVVEQVVEHKEEAINELPKEVETVNPAPTVQETPVESQNTASPNNEVLEEKSNTKINIVIVAVIVVLLFVAAFVFILPHIIGEKKEDSTSKGNSVKEDKKDEQKEKITASDFNGVYERNGIVIKIYAIDDDRIVYFAENTSTDIENVFISDGYFELKDGKLVESLFGDVLEISLSEDGKSISLSDTSRDSNFKNGKYEKISEYTLDNYYTDKYGDEKYLSSQLSGVYEKEDRTMYLLQLNEETVRVYSDGGSNGIIDMEFSIQGNKLVEEFFDDIYEITFGDDKITFSGSETYDGEYKKAGELTKEIVVNNIN